MNHLHTLLTIRPDVAKSWTPHEVARRWRLLFPRFQKDVQQADAERDIEEIAASPMLVELYRERLCSISWFHRCLNEYIARLANQEDGCTGRFWEGRFKCQRVKDAAGIVACSAYIDLNPIRAKQAESIESSDHTSAQDRIHELTQELPDKAKQWAEVPLITIEEATQDKITTTEYLEIVDQTGRHHREGKGSIPDTVAPILKRLGIRPEGWMLNEPTLGARFKRMIGTVEQLRSAAQARGKQFRGIMAARMTFEENVGTA